jgi:hypothetical protein
MELKVALTSYCLCKMPPLVNMDWGTICECSLIPGDMEDRTRAIRWPDTICRHAYIYSFIGFSLFAVCCIKTWRLKYMKIQGDQKVFVHVSITVQVQLMVWRWLIQNTFGIWTMLCWTRSSRTQFGVSINVWRLAGDTLNITCNFLYCNHEVHRNFLITLDNFSRCLVLLGVERGLWQWKKNVGWGFWEDGVLRRLFGCERDEVTGGWINLNDEGFLISTIFLSGWRPQPVVLKYQGLHPSLKGKAG